MTTQFHKYGCPHVAVIEETKFGYKCIGYDFSYRMFRTFNQAFTYMKAKGYKVRSKW